MLAVGLAACGGESSEPETPAINQVPLAERVQADYAANPDFYRFSDLEALPADLMWQDGAEQAEIGSPLAKKGGTNYVTLFDFPRTFRTVGPDSNATFRRYLMDDVTLPLAFEHPDTREFIPGIAMAWSIDTTTGTVFLRLDPDARWSDGEPITTDDFFFTFWFMRTEEIQSPWHNNWYSTQFTRITRYSDQVMSVTFANRKPDFPNRVLALRPTPEHAYAEFGDDFVERYQWRFIPTTGPYVLKPGDLEKGRTITLTRDENWWAKDKKHHRYRYNPDRLHFSIIRDNAKRFEAFKRGDVDQFVIRTSDFWYEKLPDTDPDVEAGYIAKSTFYMQYPRPPWGLWINSSQPLLNDENVRLGIHHATNWDVVIDQYFRGDAERLEMAWMGYPGFEHPTLKARGFDVEKAQSYFAEAGFNQRGSDGVLVNDKGQRLAFTMSSGYDRFTDLLTILKQEALKAGLELRVEMMDSTAAWKKVQEKKHELHFVAFAPTLESYPRFWDFYHSENAYENAFLEDGTVNPDRQIKTQTNNLEIIAMPEMDRLIDAYRASNDYEEMKQLASSMRELHHEYGSFVPGFYRPFRRLANWRWVKFPEYFNHRYVQMSTVPGEWFLHWIDTDLKQQVLNARENGETYPPMITVYDQWK